VCVFTQKKLNILKRQKNTRLLHLIVVRVVNKPGRVLEIQDYSFNFISKIIQACAHYQTRLYV